MKVKTIKNYWMISLVVGIVILFFFPEPETNFLWYVLTAVFFIVLTLILYKTFKINKINKINK